MSTHKHFDRICIAVTVFTLLLTILFLNGKALGISTTAEADDLFSTEDQNGSWDTSDATQIVLSDGGSTVKGNGAYVYQGDVYIVYAGNYVVSGQLSDGNLIIRADGDDKIRLMLDGVSIYCEDDAAIRVEQAGKVILTLAEGTENTLSSGKEYRADAVSAGVDGTIYARDDLTINGSGALSVTAQYRHGIVGNDDLVITGGSISIEAAQDGIHAHDSVRIREADIRITAGDDGITVSNDDQTASLYIASGNISIPACYEGLEAVDITIAGGIVQIHPTDDGINANGSGASVIRITGGDISIVNPDGRDADGLDSNQDIDISGGNLFISVSGNGNCAIDYGSESGGVCRISGGRVLACGGSGMAEGFDATSPQGFLMYTTSASAGTAVKLEDEKGNEILAQEIPCSFSSVIVSTPEMAVGDTCIITVGDVREEVTIRNTSANGGFGGGMPGFGGGQGMRPGGNIPEGGRQPPEMPDGTMPDFSQGNGHFDGRPNGEGQRPPEGNAGGSPPQNGDTPQTGATENPISTQTVLLVTASAAVLLAGCLIAGLYGRRR